MNSIIKKLILRIKSHGGRSNGLTTAPRKSSYNRKLYRFVDFSRSENPGVSAKVARLDIYDPNRNCNLALLVFPQGCLSYILSIESMMLGQKLINDNQTVKTRFGDSTRLLNLYPGSLISNLTAAPKLPGQYIRSAGAAAVLVKNNPRVSLIKLKSGEYRYFFSDTLAVLGKINNGDFFLKDWKLAGKSIRLGIRPRTRALVKNPVDHPMGGRTKGGTPKLTPKGKLSLNTATKLTKNKLVILKKRENKKI